MGARIWTNCLGTSKRQKKCSVCGPWIAHWSQRQKKTLPKKCQLEYRENGKWVPCKNDANVGAHIRALSVKSSNKQFIVPACYGCNKRGSKKNKVEFKLKKPCLVSAIQCTKRAKKTQSRTKSKTAREHSFNPPGKKILPPKGYGLKPGYKCRITKGKRSYWTPTGRKSKRKNACVKS